jgi:hypothetical protein
LQRLEIAEMQKQFKMAIFQPPKRNGKTFIAMEFLDGLTLKHCIGGNAIQLMGG